MSRDHELGMNRGVSRRDILHGVGALAAASILPGCTRDVTSAPAAKNYPPARTGMRGSHEGAFEVAHELARFGRSDWGKPTVTDRTHYDLVVVGAGISGLAAAEMYRRQHSDAQILILDNHDDFGGHARRMEFQMDGRTVIGYGGSQTMEDPSDYSRISSEFIRSLGVEFDEFYKLYDQEFLRRHKLAGGVFFNEREWGENRLVAFDLSRLGSYLPLADSPLSVDAAVQRMPLSEAARRELARMLSIKEDQVPEIPAEEKENFLYSMSYREFLIRVLHVTEPEVFRLFQDQTVDSCLGIEKTSAAGAIMYSGLPGREAVGIPPDYEIGPYIHHFPDGNASLARLLVRRLIPAVARGSTMHDVVTAGFDYSKLDVNEAPVRLRLNSTVVNVRHRGKPGDGLFVSYVKNDKARKVTARHCVLACYNSIVPYLCPDMPEQQRDALSQQVKAPILYTHVGLNNWHAWKNLGIGAVACPGSYHVNAMLDFPVDMGGYRFAESPDEPIIVHMEKFLHRPNANLSRSEQHRLGRQELYATTFEVIERNVREQLAGMLGEGGFDPARDINAITVNRWAHGYSYNYDFMEDAYYEDWNDPRYPHVRARQPFGRIVIANSDAGAEATVDSAIQQAHRAIGELLSG